MSRPSDRMLRATGIRNFRDYGGYAVAGGRLRKGRLYRSGEHRDAGADDLAVVGELRFTAVFDLRGDGERRAAPCPRPPDFQARVIFAEEEPGGLAPHVAAARTVPTPAQASVIMRGLYMATPFRLPFIKVMSQYFAALGEEDGPTLIHCMAGKDRTGVAVALFHTLVGVHRDDIFADYLLTNDADSIEARVAAGNVGIGRAFGQVLPDDVLQVLMSVDAAYLEAAFAAILQQHATVESYISERLGVTSAQRQRIMDRLVV